MPTVTVLYMTGTGNTWRAASAISKALSAKGWGVKLMELRRDTPLQSRDLSDDLFVLAFPVLGFGIPPLVRRMLKGIRGGGRPAAIFATWGGAPFSALWQASGLLRRKGFRVIAASGESYPFNWTQVTPAPEGARAEAATRAGDSTATKFAEQLAAVGGLAHPLRHLPVTLAAILGWPVSWLYSQIGRYVLGMLYAADESCTKCGTCVKDCPANAIAMAGNGASRRPRWRVRCEGCNRCINLCPKKAIQMSILRTAIHLTVNVVVIVAVVVGLNRLSALVALPGWISVPAWIVLFFVSIVYLSRLQGLALEPLLFRMENLHGARALLKRSWTVSFPRYRAEGFKPRG